MILISAMSKDRVIGSGDGMPWNVPQEYQHFLDTIRGQTIIMGRRSFQIFGDTLTSRQCFVVTRGDLEFPGAVSVPSFDEAMKHARELDDEIYVAGGASIYAQAIEHADSMLLSYIKGDFQGDSLFPEFDEEDWLVVRRENRTDYELVDYIRRS